MSAILMFPRTCPTCKGVFRCWSFHNVLGLHGICGHERFDVSAAFQLMYSFNLSFGGGAISYRQNAVKAMSSEDLRYAFQETRVTRQIKERFPSCSGELARGCKRWPLAKTNPLRTPTIVLKRDMWQGSPPLSIRRVIHLEKNHAGSLLWLEGWYQLPSNPIRQPCPIYTMSRGSGGCSGKEVRDYKETMGRATETVGRHGEPEGSHQSDQSGSEEYWEADSAFTSASISSEASASKVRIDDPDPERVYGDDEQRPVWIRPPQQAFDRPKDKPLQETDVWPEGLWASQDTNSKVRVLAFVGSRDWREGLRRSEILGPAEPHVGDPFADTRACNIAPSPNVSKNDQDYDARVRKFLNDQQLTVVWPASDWYKDGS